MYLALFARGIEKLSVGMKPPDIIDDEGNVGQGWQEES
jgi:hypothetical protein